MYTKRQRLGLKGTAIAQGRLKGLARAKQRKRPEIPRNLAERGLQLQKGEFKSIDVTVTGAADTTGVVQLLNGCARGDDINERIGRQTTMKSIEIHLRNSCTDTTGVQQIHRVLIVYDSQTNATALTIPNVLTDATVWALKSLENRNRFQIILDKLINLAGNGVYPEQLAWKWYKKLQHQVTYNNGDAGTVADITTGSLYFIIIGSVSAGTLAGNVYGTCRIRYTDN